MFNGIKLPNTCKEKRLGVIIDNKLKVEPGIENSVKKAVGKEKTLKRKGLYLMES